MIKGHEFKNSSMLADCSYDEEAKELTVTFQTGKQYTYVDVDKSIYDDLINAASAGKFFNAIKNQLKQK